MALTFKSTGTTEVVIVEKDADGTRRVARAVQDHSNANQWKTQLEHPSGTRPCSMVYGDRGAAALALTHYLHETSQEWKSEKARGHRPVDTMRPDRNIRVDDFGAETSAPIRSIYTR